MSIAEGAELRFPKPPRATYEGDEADEADEREDEAEDSESIDFASVPPRLMPANAFETESERETTKMSKGVKKPKQTFALLLIDVLLRNECRCSLKVDNAEEEGLGIEVGLKDLIRGRKALCSSSNSQSAQNRASPPKQQRQLSCRWHS